MGIRKQTHKNIVLTDEVVADIETMRAEKAPAKQIAVALGISLKMVEKAVHEYALGERTKIYKAAFCDKWDFTNHEINC